MNNILGVGTLVLSDENKSGAGTSVPLNNLYKNGTEVPAPEGDGKNMTEVKYIKLCKE